MKQLFLCGSAENRWNEQRKLQVEALLLYGVRGALIIGEYEHVHIFL